MTIIEKIRAEIERLMDEYKPIVGGVDELTGAHIVLAKLISFLSTLESEKPMEQDAELEKEIGRVVSEYSDKVQGTRVMKPSGVEKIARHFAEFGYRYGFLEGAKTQREEDDQLVDTIYQQGIEKGKDEMKEQAIEGHLFRYPPFTNPLISVSGINPEAFTNGDTKVKLIIIKEEER